jgi:glucose-1-phosphate adenylyltransferase
MLVGGGLDGGAAWGGLLEPGRQHRQLARRTVAMILAGGRGARLEQLTARRAKPAVHFGGKYRIVDFVLSNCINSGVRRIYVATQYKSHSLLRHLQRGWGYLRAELNEFVELLPAQQRIDEKLWYRGTADAVFQNLDILASEGAEYVLILAGDQVYRMDYQVMLEAHVESGAEVTVGCIEVPKAEASAFGVMAVDERGFITRFLEKPSAPPGLPERPERALVSMGIYVFGAEALYRALRVDAAQAGSAHDFGRDVIPRLVGGGRARAHRLSESAVLGPGQTEPYWRDVGTLDAYWAANLDLTRARPEFDLYDPRWPIYTYQAQLPPAKLLADAQGTMSRVRDSVLCDGCFLTGGEVVGSLLGTSVHLEADAQLIDTVVLPDTTIGRGARLARAIVDRGVTIPPGLEVGADAEADGRRFHRTPGGVTLITQEMLDPAP